MRMDMGKFHKRYLEIRLNKETGEISSKTAKRFTTVIENAMALGQTKAVLAQLAINTHFQDLTQDESVYGKPLINQVTDPICKSTPVRHMWTLQELKTHNDEPVRIQINSQLGCVLRWLYKQGVHFCFTSVMLKPVGIFFSGNPTLASKVFLTAIFLPENPELSETPGTLLSLWNDVRTPKCLDSSMVPVWTERVYNAIQTGLKNVVLCTLQLGDYEEYVPDAEEEDNSHKMPEPMAGLFGYKGGKDKDKDEPTNPFLCPVGLDHLTMEYLTNVVDYTRDAPSWLVDRRFADMIKWVSYQKWSWTLCFATTPLEKDTSSNKVRISRWAYFTVLLDPLTTDVYL